jgi:prenyltransferase beta subunit
VVGALTALDAQIDDESADGIASFVDGCQLPGSGFTYRDPDAAGDSLATAAVLLDGSVPDPAQTVALQSWLRSAQTPYEGGVMYMPGRGAEVRCTLWAASALQRTGSRLDVDRLGTWLTGLQNVDGGVGYWVGRGSDLVSTASAVEVAVVAGLDPAAVLDTPAVLAFAARCRTGSGFGPTPGAEPTLAATAQAARILLALGQRADGDTVAHTLNDWASVLGGFSALPRGVPDLLSTYQAVLTLQRFGLEWSAPDVRRLLRRLQVEGGYAWSPLSRRSGGPLATAMGRLLAAAVDLDLPPLPRLSL